MVCALLALPFAVALRAPLPHRIASHAPRIAPAVTMVTAKDVLKAEPWTDSDAQIAVLRVVSAVLMVHHGSEGGFWPANVGSEAFEGFTNYVVKPYLSFLPGPATLWSALHDYVEYWGAVLLGLGLATRPAAGLLSVTMLGAVSFHLQATGLQGFPFGHVDNYSYDFEEPALYLAIFLVFLFNGAGKYSLDSVISEKLGDE